MRGGHALGRTIPQGENTRLSRSNFAPCLEMFSAALCKAGIEFVETAVTQSWVNSSEAWLIAKITTVYKQGMSVNDNRKQRHTCC